MDKTNINIEKAQELPDFIKLWNFGNPSETEKKFRELLPIAESSRDLSYLAQLLTQVARTLGLQSKFDDAHSVLDKVEKILSEDLKLAKVRYLLERGRVFNSSNLQDEALPLFSEASELAQSIGETNLAIDAVHMVAIAIKDPKDQVEWNLKGIGLTEKSEKSHGWLNAFYNNIGESYLLLKDYENARYYFHKLAELQREKRGEADVYTLKDEARAIRLSGNPIEALQIIEPILRKLESEQLDDGWIREEMAENLEALGKTKEAKKHFVKAYELLSLDKWCLENEKDKIERLRKMAQ